MRVLQLIGFAIALLSWTGAMGLPVAGAPRGQPVKVAHPGVLYSFGSASDGLYPQSGVAYANGVLYVTTVSGGKYGGGTRLRRPAPNECFTTLATAQTEPNRGLV